MFTGALEAGAAPHVVLKSTEEGALRWCALADLTRLAVARAMGEWIARGASAGGDTPRLVREVSTAIGDRHVPMVPPAVKVPAIRNQIAQ